MYFRLKNNKGSPMYFYDIVHFLSSSLDAWFLVEEEFDDLLAAPRGGIWYFERIWSLSDSLSL